MKNCSCPPNTSCRGATRRHSVRARRSELFETYTRNTMISRAIPIVIAVALPMTADRRTGQGVGIRWRDGGASVAAGPMRCSSKCTAIRIKALSDGAQSLFPDHSPHDEGVARDRTGGGRTMR